jgi:hypothetical protein
MMTMTLFKLDTQTSCLRNLKEKLITHNNRLTDQLAIEVDGQRIEETASEKLIGMVVNNRLSCKEHLHGDQENPGLVSQLKRRVGTLRRQRETTNDGE